MNNYLYYTQGQKHIIEMDGWMYAAYASSPYHLYEYNAKGWTRIKHPQRSHKEKIIGGIFELLKAKFERQLKGGE
jgi:hypothetical protein